MSYPLFSSLAIPKELKLHASLHANKQ